LSEKKSEKSNEMSQNKKNEDGLEQPSTMYEMKTKPEANSKVFKFYMTFFFVNFLNYISSSIIAMNQLI